MGDDRMVLIWAVAAGAVAALAVGARRAASGRPARRAALVAVALRAVGVGSGGWAGRSDPWADAFARSPLSAAELESSLLLRLFPDGAIRTAPPDGSQVCHDWTFGGTKFSDGCPVESL